MGKELTYSEKTGGRTVKTVLQKELGLSEKEISRLKFDGEILLNDEKVRVDRIMQEGDVLKAVFPEDRTDTVTGKELNVPVLYEDEDLVVLDKPAGMVVHAVHEHQDDSLGSRLQAHYHAQGQDLQVRAVGRLDEYVSGVIVYAKNRPAAARLSEQRMKGTLKKTYTAVAEGFFREREGRIDAPTVKKEGQARRETGREGKQAVTLYRVMQEYETDEGSYSLLEIQTETGRTHQIRTHMQSVGHPLAGDALYGGKAVHIKRPALHAGRIVLRTPFTGEMLDITSPLPEDMKKLLGTGRCVYTRPADIPVPVRKHRGLRAAAGIAAAALMCFGGFRMYGNLSMVNTPRQDEKRTDIYNRLNTVFTEENTFEYGMPVTAEELIRETNGYTETVTEIDPMRADAQTAVIRTIDLASGVARTFTKTVEITDTQPPVIELKSERVTVRYGVSYDPLTNILSVTDPVDGELVFSEDSGRGTYTLSSLTDISGPGTHAVTVEAVDVNGLKSTAVFRIDVEEPADSTPPVVTVRKAAVYITEGDAYSLQDNIYSVTDDTDGVLAYSETASDGSYTITGSFDPAEAGSYVITVTARDRSGNTGTESFTVYVQEKAQPSPAPSSVPAESAAPAVIPAEVQGDAYTTIHGYLTGSLGLNHAAACGIMANMYRESSYNPAAWNPAGYFGICQWGGGRYDGLFSFCEANGLDAYSLSGQLAFLGYELTGSYRRVYDQLLGVEDSPEGAYSAGYIFGMQFEVSGEYNAVRAGESAQNMY